MPPSLLFLYGFIKLSSVSNFVSLQSSLTTNGFDSFQAHKYEVPKEYPISTTHFSQNSQAYSANERILLSDSGTSGPKCTKLLNFDRYLRLTPTDIELSAGDDSIRLIDGGAYSNELTRLIAYISDMDLQSHAGEVSVLVSLLFWVSDGISSS